MLAIIAILFDSLMDISGLNFTIFADNSNALQALVSNALGRQ